MKIEIIVLIIAGIIFLAGIVRAVRRYYKDLNETEQGNFLIPEED